MGTVAGHGSPAARRGGPLRDPPALLELSLRQQGVVTSAQLRQQGVSHKTQRGRIARGLWTWHFGTVVTQPAARGTALQDAWAIALHLPRGGAVSGQTALDVWRPTNMRVRGLPRLAVVPAPHAPRVDGVRVLRLAPIHKNSVLWHSGIPLRTLGHTLMDLFTVLPFSEAQSLLDHALQLRWIDAGMLRGLAKTRLGRGRRGARIIRRLIDHASGGTHSEAERRMAALLKSSGIRGWTANYKHRATSGRVIAELDFAWPRERVCLEIDGWASHSDRRAFESDRARQNALAADGWTVLRATWAQVTREPAPLIANLRASLAR